MPRETGLVLAPRTLEKCPRGMTPAAVYARLMRLLTGRTFETRRAGLRDQRLRLVPAV